MCEKPYAPVLLNNNNTELLRFYSTKHLHGSKRVLLKPNTRIGEARLLANVDRCTAKSIKYSTHIRIVLCDKACAIERHEL